MSDNLISFMDPYPGSYFDVGETMKKKFLSESIAPSAVNEAKGNFYDLIDSCGLSDFSIDFVKSVYTGLSDFWFLVPTSTGGKYHGGRLNPSNSCGGIFSHISDVVGMMPRVLNRYRELINYSGAEYACYRECLTVACLLHDIGRLGVSGDLVYSCSDHGEVGSAMIKFIWDQGGLVSSFPFYIEEICYAVHEHMYLWRGINLFDRVRVEGGLSPSLILGAMLCECDYYSFK
jgi:hypothetical protein